MSDLVISYNDTTGAYELALAGTGIALPFAARGGDAAFGIRGFAAVMIDGVDDLALFATQIFDGVASLDVALDAEFFTSLFTSAGAIRFGDIVLPLRVTEEETLTETITAAGERLLAIVAA